MAISPELQPKLQRQSWFFRHGFRGVGANGVRQLITREQAHPTSPDAKQAQEDQTELWYARFVYGRGFIEHHVILSNALVEINRLVTDFLNAAPVANEPKDALVKAQAVDQAFGGERAQFLLLQELYLSIDLITSAFPEASDLIPLQHGIFAILDLIGQTLPNERFMQIMAINRSTEPEKIETAFTRYQHLVAKQPETPQSEITLVTSKALGKTIHTDPSTHARIREQSGVSLKQALLLSLQYKLKTIRKGISKKAWAVQRPIVSAVHSFFGRTAYDLTHVRQLKQIQYAGLHYGAVKVPGVEEKETAN